MNSSLNPIVLIALAGSLALLLALYLTPIIIRAAERYGIVDHPDGELKLQPRSIPYLGGLALFLAVLAAVVIVFPMEQRVLAILLAGAIIVCFGLVDDLGTLVPKDKLFGQIFASIVLVRAGVHMQFAVIPDPWDMVISVFWLVCIINAFNIIDVHDGLCAGVAAVATFFFGLFAVLNQALLVAVMCAAFLGGLLGFLRYNFPPARIYLGDTGSMLIGLVLGALAMIDDYSAINPLAALFSPLAVLTVPLFDLLLVVLARIYHRQPFYHGSPDHFAVRLTRRGVAPRAVLLLSCSFGAVFGVASVLVAHMPGLPGALVILLSTILAVLALIVIWRWDPRSLTGPPGGAIAAVPDQPLSPP